MSNNKWKEVSPHFIPSEVLSPDTINHPHLVDLDALMKLNALRELAGYPCYVNHQRFMRRGVVSAREAISDEDRVTFTMHLTGKAFDVSCYRIPVPALAEYAREIGFTFVKEYRSWVHCDNRDNYIIT
jgi:hypothetical protein